MGPEPVSIHPRVWRPGSSRRVIVAGLAVAALLLTSARVLASAYTDYLWFDSLGSTSVWRGLLSAKLGIAATFSVLLFGLVWVNLRIADRLAPRDAPPGPEEEALRDVREILELRPGALRLAVSLVVAMAFGATTGGRWHEWVLFRRAVTFGASDPQFGHDIGFYVFRLPFLSFVADWLFTVLLVTTLLTSAVHYLNGGIRYQVLGDRVQRATRAHLSVLFAALALAKGANYLLDRYELLGSERGVVRGASFTDVTAQLPALNFLFLISLVAAALFAVNVFRRGWALAFIAVGGWALVAVVVGVLYPAAIQRLRVEPAESTREAPYIAHNIEATRAAMKLDAVKVRPFAYDEELSADALVRNEDTIRNVRLWDPRVLVRTYQRLQEVRSFYRFTDVDVDRYEVEGRTTQIVLSARELRPDSLPSDTWENRYLAFTHGFGAVLSPANAVTSDGQPDFLVKNIPPQGEPAIEEPRLYHGERLTGYAIVNAGRDEIDYLRDDGTAVQTRYRGDGGVGIGTIPRRVAFALRFGDINPLISGFITKESRVLYVRDVRERVETLAPFLHFDRDPYPVVRQGRITWVIDGYTTTNAYPYAETADTDRLEAGSGLGHRFNYIRNSVKATVDAHDGTVNFYVVDPDDPLATAYAKAFPKLFTPASEVPDDLVAHFRYPEDLFRVQTNMWGRYHIEDATEFYSQSDRWNIAQDPDATLRAATTTVPSDREAAAFSSRTDEGRMDPYYLLMRLPDAPKPEFLILQPFVPFSQDDTRRELSAFMVAKSDPGEYGTLEVFVMPRDRQVDGPAIVNARINQEPEISQLITLLSRAGSEVLLGNLLIIPVEQSLLYVRPLYVQATGANAVPELKKVIVAFGNQIAIHDTLQQALVTVFGGAPETLEEGLDRPLDPSTGEPTPGDVGGPEAARLLDEAAAAFEAADAALRAGDPVDYARKIEEGLELFNRARQAGSTATTTTTTTTVPR